MIFMDTLTSDKTTLSFSQQNMATFFIDLSDLIKLPFKLAIDLVAQLNPAILNKVYQIIDEAPVTKRYDNFIDSWVDIESFGNVTLIKAKQLATLIVPLLKAFTSPCLLKIYFNHQP